MHAMLPRTATLWTLGRSQDFLDVKGLDNKDQLHVYTPFVAKISSGLFDIAGLAVKNYTQRQVLWFLFLSSGMNSYYVEVNHSFPQLYSNFLHARM